MTDRWTAIEGLEPEVEPLASLDPEPLARMAAAADEVEECLRALHKGGANVVGEVLAGQGTFYEYDHYPKGDVYDEEFASQYYYHAHRGLPGEHGHFHTFAREGAIPAGVEPVSRRDDAGPPTGDGLVCHLVAISMDCHGMPIGLFETNRWVTDEAWYRAEDVVAMLDRYRVDHAVPSWPANRWVTAMLRLFRPQIVALLRHRDAVVQAWAGVHPDRDAYEDRELEMTGWLRVSTAAQIEAVRAATRSIGEPVGTR